ncbi:TolC family protein [Parapedobacter sp. 10938]|uniref:TolC family protein n=1 Tax=Parapedobacter flavus TaxID=3110225 RepID=UPI002DB771AE|nr:TolC family protein [Parapedobacter sp. 10938]MEC3881214.1 TolC family protein [Parapedobacter sp. 10938]
MINPFATVLLICTLALPVGNARAQAATLTLPQCQARATQNYPMVKQRDLIAKSASYAVDQHGTRSLPQININGQATYQSAVTEIPIHVPGMDIPTMNKDQYKLYGEINQNLYDGGLTRLGKEAIEAEADVKHQALEVELYQIKARVNQLYFGILLLDAQLAQNDLLQKDIQAGLEKINAAIANGAALKSEGSLLEAEQLTTQQQATELQASRQAYLHMLGLFIGRELDEHTSFERPVYPGSLSAITRPELDWYSLQKNSLAVERRLLGAKTRPKLGLFLQAGMGRPALNMLSSDFEAYYYGGIRLSISLSGFYTLKKERAQLDVKEAGIDVQQETFVFNTNLTRHQQQTKAAKYKQLLLTDDAIIALRTSVKDAALAQLANGVINTADYVRETHAVSSARLSKIQHEIQLLKAQYDIRHTLGNIKNPQN